MSENTESSLNKASSDSKETSAVSETNKMTGGSCPAQEAPQYSRLQRTLALCALLIFAALLVWLVVILATGANPRLLLIVLFLLIVVPSVIFAFTKYVGLTVRKRQAGEDKQQH